ncbi:MAG: hypothetical protein ACTSSH_06060, partial [Candidatus Heimdallarchaeota archaeon]
REREDKAEIAAIRKKLSKRHYDQDTKYAEFVGSNDFSFNFRGLVSGFDNLLRNICLSIIIVLILVTPMVFAGNVSMNVLPNYQKQSYGSKPGMVMAIKGNVFTTYDFTGNVTSAWDEDLDDEIALLKELHATHVRYDILSSALNNNGTLTILNQGLQRIKDEGIALILGVAGDFVFSRKELIETIYRDAKIIAANYQPDYMIVYDELNGDLAEFVTESTTIYDWIPEIINVTNEIKTSSPTTKVVTTVMGFKDGFDIFSELLTNSSLNIDVVGVNFDPILFGWRLNTLLEYGSIYQNVTTTRKFWISEIGMESFNFGEDAQAKFLANIISKVSLTEELNADGLCITSLIDNLGITVDRGISSHLGLVYFNGRKKKSFDAVSYGFGTVLGVL